MLARAGATFSRKDRLRGATTIQPVFLHGKRCRVPFLRIHYLPQQDADASGHAVVVAVPQKKIRRAVQRNLLKRRLREAYRCQKDLLPATPCLRLALVYTGGTLASYTYLQNAVRQGLLHISTQLSEKR